MCGLAGIVAWDDRFRIGHATLEAMSGRVAHRGPDGSGRFRDRAVHRDGATLDIALVHARLSIIDHAGGGQPMVRAGHSDATRPVAVVFNGCIYNHRELRRDLTGLGLRFLSDHSDTETIVHGTSAWGSGLADRLDGMFAYAAWDSARARLVIARDQAGEKPLYLGVLGPDAIAFASSFPSPRR